MHSIRFAPRTQTAGSPARSSLPHFEHGPSYLTIHSDIAAGVYAANLAMSGRDIQRRLDASPAVTLEQLSSDLELLVRKSILKRLRSATEPDWVALALRQS